jgi:hypothetical protein
MTDLPKMLLAKDENKRFSGLIEKAVKGMYHDYKSDLATPKVELVNDLSRFPELEEIRQMVMEGEFDEEADDEDLAMLKKDTPKELWKTLGLE